MFYHQKHYHNHGFLFILSLIAAFMLGRKSEQYGYSIISRGCCSHADDDDFDMMDEPTPSDNSYPQ
ncbi:hypothetical protein [Desulfosporosinus metallidurans]|uniref:hypothetical protein n=1 Tax=Desulfosporosinus metallidurans TaxID=1888891 RepID=UPI00094D918B|nr:hypothetical protein [Desulfosporosinus metallidurans]